MNTKDSINRVIISTKLKRQISSISELTPDMLEKFFYWFSNTQKIFDFFDNDRKIKIHKHKSITDVSFYYTDKSSVIKFRIADDDNNDLILMIVITIIDSMRIKDIVTYSNFEKGWNVKFNNVNCIDSKYGTLYSIIKNLMSYLILYRAGYLLSTGGYNNETIPDIF